MEPKIFRIAPGSALPLWFCGTIGGLTLALGFFLGTFFFFGARIVTIEVASPGVRVSGDVYGRFISTGELRKSEARALDVRAEPGYAPSGRTNGMGLPDYQSGWFRLANHSDALLFVTDWSRAVLVPTTANYVLIVSPADPQAFLAALAQPPANVAAFSLAAPPSALNSSLSSVIFVVALLVPLGIAGLMGYIAYSTRNVEFIVSNDELRIRGDLFGRRIPRSTLRAQDAQVVNLKTDKAHRPFLRTMGVGLPGYLSGWFRLNDRGKGLLFLTDYTRAVCVPTDDGYTLVISPADPDAFVAALAQRS